MTNDDDPPLSLATFDEIADELAKRSIGCVVACLINMTPTEEHVYANFYGKTVAIGLCNRVLHNILHEPSPNVHDDAG
jgi:hypothetical protein